MTNTAVKYSAEYTLSALQLEIKNTEAVFLKLIKLTNEGGQTVGEFEQVDTELPPPQLFMDPAGNLPAPGGTTLIGRGEVFIQGNKQKVAAFRPN